MTATEIEDILKKGMTAINTISDILPQENMMTAETNMMTDIIDINDINDISRRI